MTHIIQFDFSGSWVSAVFKGLREAAHLIQQQHETEDHFDGLFLLEHFEELFGTTCVVAQTYVNRTWADITKADLKVNPGEGKWQMIPTFGRKIGQSKIAQVELVYHLANYWKHCDDWRDWAPQENEARYHTINVLAAVGITQDTDFPCARGLEMISTGTDALFDELETILFGWRQAAVEYHVAEASRDS